MFTVGRVSRRQKIIVIRSVCRGGGSQLFQIVLAVEDGALASGGVKTAQRHAHDKDAHQEDCRRCCGQLYQCVVFFHIDSSPCYRSNFES